MGDVMLDEWRSASTINGIGAVSTGTVVDADASAAAVDVSPRVALFRAVPSAVPANADRVHDSCHPRCLERNRFGDLALEIGIDHTIQIDHVIQSLHVE